MTTPQDPPADRPPPADELSSPVVDLRQYTLFPGTRDRFVALFDGEFVEAHEALGSRAIGQFRDLGDPNRFVWMRGFPDMPGRERALNAFYNGGPAWAAHGETARSMLIDSTDALLLKPVRPDSGFALDDPAQRPPIDSDAPDGVVIATIHHFEKPVSTAFVDFYETVVLPVLRDSGAHRLLGMFETKHSPNNFPRLPIREGENVFVTFTGFKNVEKYHEFMTALGRNRKTWKERVYPELTGQLLMPPRTLRLAPTTRSQLRD
ncbi:NIPSNAP family protein [Pseudonocardia acaciae]|uniref:NIPSNAP family protein n=1 Tax=Pseudonocardia acaciae TaxID=551276 RepID=UPI00068826BC|nr:NIPSNAP family protein [Pseudonocardia acaciae]